MAKIINKKFYLYGDSERPVTTIETDDDEKAFGLYSWFEDGGFQLRMSVLPYLAIDSVDLTEKEFIKVTDIKEYEKLIRECEEI